MSSYSESVSVFWLFKVGISIGKDRPLVIWYLTPKLEILLISSRIFLTVEGIRSSEILSLNSLYSSNLIDSGALSPN